MFAAFTDRDEDELNFKRLRRLGVRDYQRTPDDDRWRKARQAKERSKPAG